MSKLVPQKRLDKNGRLVTRHVKADMTDAPAVLPAPMAPQSPAEAPQSAAVAVKRFVDTFLTPSADNSSLYVTGDGNAVNIHGFKELLDAIPSDTLSAVTERLAELTKTEQGIVHETVNDMARRYQALTSRAEYAESMLHYNAELAPVIAAFSTMGYSSLDMHHEADYINGRISARYPGSERRLMFADKNERNVVRAATAVLLVTGDDRNVSSLVDLSWIGANIEDIAPYKDILRTHGRMDRKFIEELMASDAPSLAGGYL